MESSYLRSLLGRFPKVQVAFGYGSALFARSLPAERLSSMVDLLMVVDDAEKWHADNLEKNPEDYAPMMGLGGSKVIAGVQQKWPLAAPVYYNVGMPIDNKRFKYGVTTKAALMEDLETWRWLYFAGRLHKPVLPLTPLSPDVEDAMRHNRINAARVAMLLSPPNATLRQILTKLCNLSYSGDARRYFCERGGGARVFKYSPFAIAAMYLPTLRALPGVKVEGDADGLLEEAKEAVEEAQENALARLAGEMGHPPRPFTSQFDSIRLEHDASDEGLQELFRSTPAMFRLFAEDASAGERTKMISNPFFIMKAANYENRVLGRPLPFESVCAEKAIRNIVGRTSLQTALKGVFTAGPWTAMKYACSKIDRM